MFEVVPMFPELHDEWSVPLMELLDQICVQKSTFSGRFDDSYVFLRITFLRVTSMTTVCDPDLVKHFLTLC